METPASQPRSRMLSVHDPARRTPADEVTRLAAALEEFPEVAADQGAATRLLTDEVSRLLGKEAAALLPSGKMAQQIALRLHADPRPGRRVTLAHPTNHLTTVEDANHALLHDLQVRGVGDRYRLMSTDHLATAVRAPDVASVLWELPQRELGGELPAWGTLQEQLDLTHAAGLATHLDGARLWQAEPYYDRPLTEICAGFDTVYVSLYKDLGAPRGAILAGDRATVDAATAWSHRMGGTVDEVWPISLLALDALRHIRPRMPEFVAHARAVAAEVHRSTQATVRPVVPQAAMFHVHLPVAAEAAQRAHDQVRRETGLALTFRMRTSPDPGRCWFESTIGASALEIPPGEVADAIARIITLARG